MKQSDRKLGMGRPITRRDIVHGMGALGATMVLPGALTACSRVGDEVAAGYPPALTGMRGNHEGAFEVAHALGREGRTDWGPVEAVDDLYDLIIVGAGLSGLSAAHYFRREHPDARILILDNHDDFGGHAKRNEFEIDGETLITHGGSENMVEPEWFSDNLKSLLSDIGVHHERFETAFDQDFFRRHDLKSGLFFSRERWGEDQIVPSGFDIWGSLPTVNSDLSLEDLVAQMPISDAAKAQFLRLFTTEEDRIAHIPADEKYDFLSGISYRDFLSEHLGVTEPDVFAVLQNMTGDMGLGIESVTAYVAITYVGMPGVRAAGLPDPDDEPYIYHFPDGNASIARLLVRKMIPGIAPGHTMEDVVTAEFDYSKLDRASSNVKVRLNSTVTLVAHTGDTPSADSVDITYVQDGQAYGVRGRNCILACNNSIIPYICPELPQSQQAALANQVKQPLLYTNVLCRNWQAWKNLGVAHLYSSDTYHASAFLDFPVSLGDYQFSTGPDEPVVVNMQACPHSNYQGLTPHEHFRQARHELMTTSFEDIERSVRAQLGAMLGAGGFDPATDILAITVNRWSHGYAYEAPMHGLFGTHRYDESRTHIAARQRRGRITIANADAGGSAMMDVAIDQAYRAVTELLGR
jgi:spermidine dehydrogenase